MKTIKLTKDGNWIDFEVTGFSIEEKEEIASELNLSGRALNVFMNNESGSVQSKKTAQNIQKILEDHKESSSKIANESIEAASKPNNIGSKRTVMTRYYVESNKIANHGRYWVASQHDIDTGKVPTGFEGEQVCYVYS